MRRLSLLVAATALLTTACRPDTVRIAFHPRPDAHYRYAVDVTAETETRLAGRQPTRNRTDDHLEADHAVLAVDAGLATVQVRLHSGTGPDRSFEVRFDRAAALTEVRRVEDLPASALGELGLAEVFPAAAGAPPDRPLRPGSAWTIDEPVTLPPSLPSRLTGSGRLVDLGVVSSRKVATVHSSYSLPVHQTLNTPQGEVVLDGTETTSVSATHDLADGAIEVFRARTTGRFDLSVVPPPGTSGTSIGGQLDVEVRSSTRRTA